MPNLTDYIEEYLKKLLLLSNNRHIEIRRRELAGKFCCVPSQINYVLERRFTIDRGYLVESRRGGGGYIRIYRIEPEQVKPWQELIDSLNEKNYEAARVRQMLLRLVEEKIISRREAAVLNTVIDDQLYCSAGIERTDVAKLQLTIILSALREMLKTGY